MNKVQPIRQLSKVEKLKTILLKQSYRNYFLFLIGINTGIRISDILKLQVCDVLNSSHIVIKEQKTGKVKRFVINKDLRSEILRYTENMEENEYLFHSKKGGHIGRVQAYTFLNNAAKEIGLEDIGTHTLRKTFGYHFYKKTKDVALLQNIFNHSAPSVTLRYIGINQDIVDAAVENFSL